MKKKMPMEKLLGELTSALTTYYRLAFDEEYKHDLGKPCSPRQIAVLEKLLGKPLPPSYRAFLELHNGWTKFNADANLLAVEDQGSEWVKKRLKNLGTLFYDYGENPFKEGAIPVLLGKDSKYFLIVDPRTVRKNGEMDFVSFDICHEEDRFADFNSFLQYQLDLRLEMIEDQTKGEEEDEEEDEE